MEILKLEDFECLVPCAVCGHDSPQGRRDTGVFRTIRVSHTVQGSFTEEEGWLRTVDLFVLTCLDQLLLLLKLNFTLFTKQANLIL
jgi:hypothetical protein